MNSFDDRKKSFEKKFAHDEELQFKISAKRNKYIGEWVSQILGYLIYGNLNKQPQISIDLIVSSNHVYAFFLLSFLGLLSFNKNSKKKIITYLFSLSIFLEISHLIIPNRGFQFEDLFGNMIGVILSIVVFNLINYWRKR